MTLNSIDMFVTTLRSFRRDPDDPEALPDVEYHILGVFESKYDAVDQIPDNFFDCFRLDISQCKIDSSAVATDNRGTPPDNGILLHYAYGERDDYDKIMIQKISHKSKYTDPYYVYVMMLESYRCFDEYGDSYPGYDTDEEYNNSYRTFHKILGVYDSVRSVVRKIPSIDMPALGERFPDERFFNEENYRFSADNRGAHPGTGLLVLCGDSEGQHDAIYIEKARFIKKSKTQ
eukprot:15365712-Ditylum_brightwellii.AAC.1